MTVELTLPDLQESWQLDATKTALLLVDLQNHSCHPDGYRFGGEEAVSALEGAASLLARTRAAGGRVLWLKSVRRADQLIFTHYGLEPYRLEGTWDTEIASPLDPRQNEPVFPKYTSDCFYDTELADYLERSDMQAPHWTFIVVGTSFPGCVLHAITGLAIRDHRVVVPMDCVAPNTGTRAMIALAWCGSRKYGPNVTPLAGQEGLSFA